MSLSTHILDTSVGRPASGVPIVLERLDDHDGWTEVFDDTTNEDGRVPKFTEELEAGTYRLTFDVAAYWEKTGTPGFYPTIAVVFEISDPAQHYHVPLLLAPWGYSTYRGS